VTCRGRAGQAAQTGLLQSHEQFMRHGHAVRVHDRLVAASGHLRHDLHDLRVDQRFTTGDRHGIGLANAVEDIQVADDIRQTLVTARVVRGIATFAVDVALLRRLEPGDHVVGHAPGQAIEFTMIQGAGMIHE